MSPFALKPEFSLVLGSGSPRRKELLAAVGLEFTVRTSDADETAPSNLTDLETVQFVAEQKAKDLLSTLRAGEVLLCADTEVWQNGERFGKPVDRADARGSEDLGAADDEEIAVQRLEIHAHVRHGLSAVEEHTA